jgi:hypothetical protein
MTIKATILSEIRTVATEHHATLAPLSDDLPLQDLGLDSLCFAVLFARLEDITGYDPLALADGARLPSTVGELIALYEATVV